MPTFTSTFIRGHDKSDANLSSRSRTGRMEAKGCAKPTVWKDARRRFYWNLRARLAQDSIIKQLQSVSPDLSLPAAHERLQSLVSSSLSDSQAYADELEKLDLKPTLVDLQADHASKQFSQLAAQDHKAALHSLVHVFGSLSEDDKVALLHSLQNSLHSPGTSLSM